MSTIPAAEVSPAIGHQSENAKNYITVIPVEYPPRRVYPPPADFAAVEQYRYREYLRERTREEYMRGDYNINSGPHYADHGPLYTVSQRFDRGSRDCYPNAEQYERPHVHQHHSVPGPSGVEARQSVENVKEERPQPRLKNGKRLKMCIYFMSPAVIQFDLENGSQATAYDIVQRVISEEELGLPRHAADIFTLWMYSPLLEVQLKPHHKPLQVRREWPTFLERFTQVSEEKRLLDEPIVSFQRNIFFSKQEEMKICDQRILELLYEEAKFNILGGRYPCELTDYIMLGSIQARLELGPYNPQVHTHDFFREHAHRFLPRHTCRPNWFLFKLLHFNSKDSAEVRLLEQFHRIPSSTPQRKLLKRYLEFCWTLPYYGSAFFHGQIEQPVKGLASLFNHPDIPVLVAINSQGIYVFDPERCTVLLGMKYEELSWDFAKPSQEKVAQCLPCLFLQFTATENNRRVSKILQVFSKEAVMMDSLISSFVDDLKQNVAACSDSPDGHTRDVATDTTDDVLHPLSTVSRRDIPESCLSNKLNRLSLATFDDEGRCISRMGSWSFSR